MKTFLEYAERNDRIYTILSEIVAKTQDYDELNQLLTNEGFWDSFGHGAGWLLSKARNAVGNSASGLAKGAKRGWESGNRGETWNKADGIAALVQKTTDSLNRIIPQLENPEEKQWLTSVIERLAKISV